MENKTEKNYNGLKLENKEYEKIKDIVFVNSGIRLTAAKRPLIISRLSKRLKVLGVSNYKKYLEIVENNKDELFILLNILSTNVTSFFREKHHFDYLANVYLAEYKAQNENRKNNEIRIWSAGCSTGEEPYSIALTMTEETNKKKSPAFRILASDINTEVLDKASEGIYESDKINGIPYYMLKKYFKLGIGNNSGKFKAKDILKRNISFKRINLSSDNYPIKRELDVIFCRNVFIYFHKETQKKILNNFWKYLKVGGILFLGHSESVDFNDKESRKWKMVGRTIFKKL